MDTGYIIDKNNTELRWLVYSTSEDWDKGQAAPYIADYCYVVKKVFENIFGVDYVNSHKNLAVIYSADYPIIFRENHIIFLTVKGAFFCQCIFQFAHELCHFFIPKKVCKKFRWLEETLCVLASLFTLKTIQSAQEDPQLITLIDTYIQSVIVQEAKPAGGIPLAEFIKKNYDDLVREPCKDNYSYNRTIALGLYPLFFEHPQLWGIVPHLHKLTDDMPLEDALMFLCQSSNLETINPNLIDVMC